MKNRKIKNNQYNKSLLNNKPLGYKMLIPATILICVVSLYPLIRGVMMSFMNYNLLKPKKIGFNGIDNYIKLVTKDDEFWGVLGFTFIYAISVVVIAYVMGLIFAMLLNRDIKCRGLFRALILIPWVIPSSVAATTWQWVLNDQFGLINNILQTLHIIEEPILFLADKDLTRITVIWTGAWKSFPFMMITLLAGLQTISDELYEAAEIDGAGFWQKFAHITMPMLKNVTATCTTLMFIWTFNNFDSIYLLTKGGPNNSTYVLSIFTYYTAFMRSNLGYAAAISTILLVVLLIFIIIYLRLISRDDLVSHSRARKGRAEV